MLKNKALDLYSLSFIWGNGSKHHIQTVSKKQHTALSNLPPVALSDDGQSLQITLACNSKNARAFTTAFRHSDWGWLTSKFVLSVNRKINSDRQLQLLKKLFIQKNEVVQIYKQSAGKTQLTIYLSPKTSLPPNVLKFAQNFIQSFQPHEVQQ